MAAVHRSVPFVLVEQFARACVPETNRPVERVERGNEAAARCKGHRIAAVLLAVEPAALLSRGDLPQANRPIEDSRRGRGHPVPGEERRGGTGSQRPAVGRKPQGDHHTGVSREATLLASRGHVPKMNRLIAAPRGQVVAVRGESQRHDPLAGRLDLWASQLLWQWTAEPA